MPPTTTSTPTCSTSLDATASATASSVALSSTNSSTGRPSRPPRSLMSSTTILATLALAMPMNERAPDWSVTRPTRAGRLIVLIVRPSRPIRAEVRRGLRLVEVTCLLDDRQDLGVGDEPRPPGFVPIEEHPHAALLGRVAEHRRALASVLGALVRALRAEDVQEPLDVLDLCRCQDHVFPFGVHRSGSHPADRLVRRRGSFSASTWVRASVDLPISRA